MGGRLRRHPSFFSSLAMSAPTADHSQDLEEGFLDTMTTQLATVVQPVMESVDALHAATAGANASLVAVTGFMERMMDKLQAFMDAQGQETRTFMRAESKEVREFMDRQGQATREMIRTVGAHHPPPRAHDSAREPAHAPAKTPRASDFESLLTSVYAALYDEEGAARVLDDGVTIVQVLAFLFRFGMRTDLGTVFVGNVQLGNPDPRSEVYAPFDRVVVLDLWGAAVVAHGLCGINWEADAAAIEYLAGRSSQETAARLRAALGKLDVTHGNMAQRMRERGLLRDVRSTWARMGLFRLFDMDKPDTLPTDAIATTEEVAMMFMLAAKVNPYSAELDGEGVRAARKALASVEVAGEHGDRWNGDHYTALDSDPSAHAVKRFLTAPPPPFVPWHMERLALHRQEMAYSWVLWKIKEERHVRGRRQVDFLWERIRLLGMMNGLLDRLENRPVSELITGTGAWEWCFNNKKANRDAEYRQPRLYSRHRFIMGTQSGVHLFSTRDAKSVREVLERRAQKQSKAAPAAPSRPRTSKKRRARAAAPPAPVQQPVHTAARDSDVDDSDSEDPAARGDGGDEDDREVAEGDQEVAPCRDGGDGNDQEVAARRGGDNAPREHSRGHRGSRKRARPAQGDDDEYDDEGLPGHAPKPAKKSAKSGKERPRTVHFQQLDEFGDLDFCPPTPK